jgi:hypothetical protein
VRVTLLHNTYDKVASAVNKDFVIKHFQTLRQGRERLRLHKGHGTRRGRSYLSSGCASIVLATSLVCSTVVGISLLIFPNSQQRMSQQIVVKKNAPGWPAMVSSKFTSNQKAIRDQIKSIKETKPSFERSLRTPSTDSLALATSAQQISETQAVPAPISETKAATSMWLLDRYNAYSCQPGQFRRAVPQKPSPFAPKIVRQCGQCQMLYTNFHKCQEDGSSEKMADVVLK